MEPIAFGIRKCSHCGGETADWRIEGLSWGKVFPEFEDIIQKINPEDPKERSSEEQNDQTDAHDPG